MAVKLGTKVNQFLRLKKKISAKQKEVDEMKSEAAVMARELIIELEDTGTEKVESALGSIKLKEEIVGSVKNWPKFYAYIHKNNAYALLQKRISNAAYKEYVEAGERIPGIEKMKNKSLIVGHKRGVK